MYNIILNVMKQVSVLQERHSFMCFAGKYAGLFSCDLRSATLALTFHSYDHHCSHSRRWTYDFHAGQDKPIFLELYRFKPQVVLGKYLLSSYFDDAMWSLV